DLDESDVTDHAVRGEAQLPVGLGAHHEPDLGHGRVLLGVQVTGDGFGLDAAQHVRRGERRLDPSADPFGYQCLHQGSGCWVARWLECGWCDQLTNGGCCDDAASGLVPLIAALFQALVDLEAHLSRLLSSGAPPQRGRSPQYGPRRHRWPAAAPLPARPRRWTRGRTVRSRGTWR